VSLGESGFLQERRRDPIAPSRKCWHSQDEILTVATKWHSALHRVPIMTFADLCQTEITDGPDLSPMTPTPQADCETHVEVGFLGQFHVAVKEWRQRALS
jgi:hypothetical protein